MVELKFWGMRSHTAVVKAVTSRGDETLVECDAEGIVSSRAQYPRGMTMPQRAAFRIQVKQFIESCDDKELAAAKEHLSDARRKWAINSLLQAADQLLKLGTTSDEVREMLDQHLVKHVMDV